MTPQVREQDAVLFDIRPAVAWATDRQGGQQIAGQKVFVGENAPRGTALSYYLKSAGGDVKLTIADVNGRIIRTFASAPERAGINRVMWNLAADSPQGQGGGGGGGRGGAPSVEAGTYLVSLTAGGKTQTKPVTVLQDRWVGERMIRA